MYLAEVRDRALSPNAYFDEDWYRKVHPDVGERVRAGDLTCGFEHYVLAGRAEGRRPARLVVDADWYFQQYPEAVADLESGRFLSELEHYLVVGQARGYSPVPGFDEAWYLENYPLARAAVASGAYRSGYAYFVSKGLTLGHRPSADFDGQSYRRANPDVDLAVRLGTLPHPLEHWLEVGVAEGRPRHTSPGSQPLAPDMPWLRFDPIWYLQAYPEVAEEIDRGSYPSAADHYLERGRREGLNPNGLFSEPWYRSTYVGVAQAIARGEFSSGFDHYIRFGWSEGKAPGPLAVMADWYRSRYPDVDASIRAGHFADAHEHYWARGSRELRDPNPVFDEAWYRSRYPDIAQAIATGRWISAYHHFAEVGCRAGYRPTEGYSEEYYFERNPDVRQAVEQGHFWSGYDHLVRYGWAQGRPWDLGAVEAPEQRAARALAEARLVYWLSSGRSLEIGGTQDPEVSILLVLHNAAALTAQCLESIPVGAEGVTYEVLIFDNASADQTPELLKRVVGARVEASAKNIGFLLATNRLAAQARGRALLLLNNDTILFPGVIAAALERLDSAPDIGVVGGRVLGSDGWIQEAGSFVRADGTTDGYGKGLPFDAGEVSYPREVDYVSGAFLLTKRSLFAEVGGFDEDFAPCYYEDIDYCFRLRQRGFRSVYEPAALLVHLGQGSLGQQWHVNRFLQANRPKFSDRHAAALAQAPDPGETVVAAREKYRGRILFIDDHLPDPLLGSGFPRAKAILEGLRGLGWWVTHVRTTGRSEDRMIIGDWGTEYVRLAGLAGLEAFLEGRPGFFDVIVVSRLHNLENLLARRPQGGVLAALPLIYDAEAIFSDRTVSKAELDGLLFDQRQDAFRERARELDLAARADEVWSVSPRDAEVLRESGCVVRTVGHAPRLAAELGGPTGREGILFVGRLLEHQSPNVDGVSWFCQHVLPLVDQELGHVVPVTIVGALAAGLSLGPRPLQLLGTVGDLEELYQSHRLFIAPCRFGAGISIKSIDAVAAGLPIVATSLILQQLGWTPEVEALGAAADDPASFGREVCRLYRDDRLWRRIQRAGFDRVACDFGADRLQREIERSLEAVCARVVTS